MADQPPSTGASLEEVLRTAELSRRPARPPDFEAESRALGMLAQEMAACPGNVLQKLVELVRELCGADSAGVSILEPGDESGLFRWHAAAGAFAAQLIGTMPREASPSGTVLARNTVLLFDRAERHFPALRGVQPPIFENLLVPFQLEGRPVGTLWAIAHNPERRFDAEDARLLSSLGRFASAAYRLILAREAAGRGRPELERQVQERTRALSDANTALSREVEERVRTEGALRRSEKRLRRVTEIDAVGIIFFQADGRVTDANEAFLRMSGYGREDLAQGRVRWDVMTPPEWMPRSRQAVAELEATGRTTPYQKQYVRKDGTRWWGLFAAARISPGEAVEYVLDVSEQRRGEERLRQSEERWRLIVESARDFAIITLDAQNRITSWNPGAEAIFGYPAEAAIGRSGAMIFTPEDRASGAPQREIEEALRSGRAEDERWHVRQEGRRFWGSGVLTSMRGPGGQGVGFLKILRDLTAVRQAQEAQRQAEERFRLFVASLHDYAIVLLDPQGRITSWNPGVERILGYSEAEVLGRHVSLFYPPGALADELPAREMATAQTEGRSENEGWRLRKGGERFWVNEVMVPLPGPAAGSPAGFAKISRDLSERRAAEEERERLLAEAEAANRAKDRFLAALSHELRTPLTPVRMALFGLQCEKRLSAAGREALDMMGRNLERERQLIDDLLDVSRIAHGKLEVRLVPVDLHGCVRAALEVCQGELRAQGLRLTVELKASHPLILGDGARLQQVCWNLLQNAAKFTPAGGTVRVSSADLAGGGVAVAVADTGVGVAPELLPKLFDPFE
ncbi:MAG: PAS domain S-box protein, partial [Verrucomicrobia bacterium]|nr:PAS domain S-box protein [Verrucomicrobiota bacterium]